MYWRMCPGVSGAHPVLREPVSKARPRPVCGTWLIDQGLAMFEFACERIIPGCSFTARGGTKEKLLEQSMDNLRERHNVDYIDKTLQEWLLSVRITPAK